MGSSRSLQKAAVYPPFSLPPHALTTIQLDWGLAGVIEMLQGNILLHLHMKKT